MRKIVMLAAMLIAPAMGTESAQAGDRGHGFHHSAPPAFAHQRHFQPPRFGHRGSVVVFKYRGGFRHGPPASARPSHVWRPYHRAPALTFGRHPHPAAWRGFAPQHRVWSGRPQRHW
jgi:hypothetical protein